MVLAAFTADDALGRLAIDHRLAPMIIAHTPRICAPESSLAAAQGGVPKRPELRAICHFSGPSYPGNASSLGPLSRTRLIAGHLGIIRGMKGLGVQPGDARASACFATAMPDLRWPWPCCIAEPETSRLAGSPLRRKGRARSEVRKGPMPALQRHQIFRSRLAKNAASPIHDGAASSAFSVCLIDFTKFIRAGVL